MGYPGIDLDENGEEIEGFLFISENLSKHWRVLDDFEGESYERVITQARLGDGSEVDAYIYRLRTEQIFYPSCVGRKCETVQNSVSTQSVIPPFPPCESSDLHRRFGAATSVAESTGTSVPLYHRFAGLKPPTPLGFGVHPAMAKF